MPATASAGKRAAIDQALALPQAAATAERAALLYCRGVVEFLADQISAAEHALAQSLALSRDLNLIAGQAGAHYFLGRRAFLAGDAQRAEAHLEAAAAALAEAGETADWSHVLAELALVEGDLVGARQLAEECLALCRQSGRGITRWKRPGC
jgi:hypothetical protein